MSRSPRSHFPRATVPLFYADFEAVGRVALTEHATLAELTAREAERVRAYHGYRPEALPSPMFRLEVLFDASEPGQDQAATQIVTQSLRLLACASNALPLWLSIPVDRYSEEHSCWVRSSINYLSGGVRAADMWQRHADVQTFFSPSPAGPDGSHWRITAHQVSTWSALLRHWPSRAREGRIALALEYLAEGIRDLVTDERRALLSASICLECLFGGDGAELRHRTSQRVAHLLGHGAPSADIYARAKKWYDARSRFVHTGTSPDLALTIESLSHLRSATTAMARLLELTGSHEASLAALDRASFERPSALESLHNEPMNAWWRIPINSVAG